MSIPKSLILLPIGLFAFAVQLFPLVGVLMVFAFAPFWPVLLVNGAAVGTAIEVWLRDEDGPSRLWLILPIAWFGGYLGLFASEQVTLIKLRTEIEAANRGPALPFDPQRQALLFVGGSDGALAYEAREMVRTGRVAVAYQRQGTGAQTRTVAFRRIPRAECDRIRQSNIAAVGVDVTGRGDSCILQTPEAPAGPIVEISGRQTNGKDYELEGTRLTIDLRMPDGATRRLVTGTAHPLPIVPMPVAGCVLGPCEIGFFRPTRATLTSDTPVALIAGALGLADARQSGTESPDQIRNRVAQIEAAAIQRDVDDLERMLADPGARVDNWFHVLRRYPERVGAYASRIMAAIERAVASGDAGIGNARTLSSLLALASPESFRSVGGRVLAFLQANPDFDGGELLTRTGDLGEPALPVLLARLERSPERAWGPAVIGLCRIGRAAAPAAGPRLLALWRADSNGHSTRGDRTDDVDQAVYAALLRLGLRDAVGEVQQRWQARWYAAAWRDINPSAPAERCDPNSRVD